GHRHGRQRHGPLPRRPAAARHAVLDSPPDTQQNPRRVEDRSMGGHMRPLTFTILTAGVFALAAGCYGNPVRPASGKGGGGGGAGTGGAAGATGGSGGRGGAGAVGGMMGGKGGAAGGTGGAVGGTGGTVAGSGG